ncbi:MAG: hypothetical protein JSV24_02290 [Bacteroidales bacterium]|nr:MAG: hypothetical protein JSV24_02290 [Bacteroidales bacterium]
MEKKSLKQSILFVLLIGSAWGLTEAIVGLNLHNSFQQIAGSLMVGLALFFIATGWITTRNILAITGIVILAGLFKMLDALLLSVPVNSNSILNPVFGFFTQGAGFLVLFGILKEKGLRTRLLQGMWGGGAALISALLFPLVLVFTGFPACVYAQTRIPLSIMFAPVAIALSFILVPLGFQLGEKLNVILSGNQAKEKKSVPATVVSPLFLVISVVIIVLVRMI